MKYKLTNIIVVWAIFIGMVNYVYAQKQSLSFSPNTWYIGAEGGVNVYFGDIKYGGFMPKLEYDELSPGAGFLFGKQLSPLFSLKGNLHYSMLTGTKQSGQSLQTFKSNSYFAAISAQLNLIEVLSANPDLKRFSIWGELGLGVNAWQSLLYDRANGDTMANVHWNSGKYKTAFMIPMGLNMKYYINSAISVDLHSSIHLVSSDMLDAKEGGIKFDHYWYSGIALNYHFGNARRNRNSNAFYQEKHDIELLKYRSSTPFILNIKDTMVLNADSLKLQSFKQKEVIGECKMKVFVPEIVTAERFYIWIDILKQNGTASGFFRLLLPSAFYPENSDIDGVSYTRIGYEYHYDFYMRLSKDSLRIPIEIVNSGRENGNYSIAFDGRVMDENGDVYPINEHQDFEVQDYSDDDKSFLDIDLYKGKKTKGSAEILDSIRPQSPVITQTKIASSKTIETQAIIKPQASINKNSSVVYRIQILACRKPSKQSDDFLKKHHIEQAIFLKQSGDWWRYNIYELYSEAEARTILQKVRTEHGLKDAFIVSYKNGKRCILKSPKNQSVKGIHHQENVNSTKNNNRKKGVTNKNEKVKTQKAVNDIKPIVRKDISVYRIEIAVSPAKPMPFRQLQNWVEKEEITEWTYENKYRYTIGGFENIQVAKAFLAYVRMQFALPDAKIVETKGDVWLRVVW